MTLQLPDDLKAMLATMKNDVGGMLLPSFSLGTRLAMHESGTRKQGDLLADIASGDMTLQPTAAELRQQFLAAPTDIESIRNENQKVDRIIAHLLIEQFSRSMRYL